MNQVLVESKPVVPAPARVPRKRPGSPLWRALMAANLLALIGVALVLRGWQLGNIPALNGGDEAWLGVQAAHLAAGEPIVWRTPTGNPVNPFLLLPLAALHLAFAPSVVVLRSVALASGVAALGANFWLCRRVFDRRAALVSTAVLAVLPIAIAYSRFAWDTSQTILATVLVLYCALSTVAREVGHKKLLPAPEAPPDWLPALLAFGAAIWIHPTNVFALWLLVVPALYRYGIGWRAGILAAWEQTDSDKTGGWNRLLAIATLGIFTAAGSWFCRGLLGTAAARLLDPRQGGLFLRRLVRLVSGGTIFESIPGPAHTSTALDAADLALVSLVLVAVLGLVRRMRCPDSGRERCLAWAVALMVGTFYLVAGPAALAPHFERYGMCLVAPIAVLLALGWSYWLGSRGLESRGFEQGSPVPRGAGLRRGVPARVAAVMLAALAWLWLAQFYRDYFLAFASSGSTSQVAFRTATIEPKLAALEAIASAEANASPAATHASGRQIWIVADSWWSYWPLAYFSVPRHDVHVVAEEEWPALSRQVAPADALWRVRFVASGAPRLPTGSAVTEDRPARATTILDYAGEPLLSVERFEAGKDRQAPGAR